MTTKKKIDMNEPLTDAQIAMLKALEAQLSQFRRVREYFWFAAKRANKF